MGPFILLIILGLLGWLAASGSLSLTGAWAVTIFLGTLSLVMIAVNPIAGVLTHRRGESCS